MLVFIGFKMLIVLWAGRPEWLNFEDNHNSVLIIVAALLGLSIVASLFAPKKEPAETGGT